MTIDQTAIAKTRLDGLPPQAIRDVVATANALELGRVDEAERHIMGALALHPEHPEVLRLLAGIQNLRGDNFGAVDSMRRAVAQRPNDALYHNTLGAVLGENTQLDAAIAALRRACELQPDLSTSWYNLGLLLMRSMRPEESAQALRRAVDLQPDFARARVMLGESLRASGRNEEAAAEYRKVIREQPTTGTAWWGLADLKSGKLDDADIVAMRRATQQPSASDDDLIALGYALAHALDDQKCYSESLAELARMHALARSRRQWNAADATRRVESILRAHTPPPAGTPEPIGGEVIFIASLPRAGSTLTEQILASHSQVFGGGELTDMPQVISDESRRLQQHYPDWVRAATPADWTRIGKRYLERTEHVRRRGARFTDKLPNNWNYVGTILAALPQARVVIVRRDPLENCLACYRQFLANNEYTRTFADLASYWRDFDRATKHWLAAYPGRVYENVYEDLVADPEGKIRELLDFCGLPFEQSCIDFHKTERDVHTPSATQVRQPIRKDTARAPRYGALLDPLRKELGLPPFVTPSQ
jgi:tetratricopeptide (TPR) repeat protein